MSLGRLSMLPLAAALLAAGPWLAPQGWQAFRHVVVAHDPVALTTLRLDALPAERLRAGLAAALAEQNFDLAESFVVLADARGVTLPEDQRARVRAGPPLATQAADAWSGFVHGRGDSTAALAGAVAADLVGYGDVRDLAAEGEAWATAARPVDPTTVALAAVGLTLTGAMVATAGSASPAKLGLATLKIARRSGRLSARLGGELAAVARGALDADGARAVLAAARAGDAAAARAGLAGVLKPQGVALVTRTATEFGTVAKTLGPRGTLAALQLADSTRDVSRLSKLAAGFGRGTYAALALLGTAALTLGSAALTLSGWLLAGLVWLLATLRVLARLVAWVLPPWRRARRA